MWIDLEVAITRILKQALAEALREVLPELLTASRQPEAKEPTAPSLSKPAHLLRPKEAAAVLAISERRLWQMTKEGAIESIRMGRSVRYDEARLREWIERSSKVQFGGHRSSGSMPQANQPNEHHSATTQRRRQNRAASSPAKPTPRDSPKNRPRDSASRDSRPRDVRGLLAAQLGVDRDKIPRLTNGMIMQAMELDIATAHGWQYLNRELPAGAFEKLVAFVRARLT